MAVYYLAHFSHGQLVSHPPEEMSLDIVPLNFHPPKLVVGLNLDSEVGSDLFGPALVLNVPVPVL